MIKFKTVSPIFILLLAALIFLPYASAEEMPKVNINTASLEELATLDLIGVKYAERIIDYRKNTGPFSNPEDLLNVKGSGQKTFEANKDRIIVK
jgi:competence protein ComEA